MCPETDKTEMWAVKRANWNEPGEKVRLKCDPKRSIKKIKVVYHKGKLFF